MKAVMGLYHGIRAIHYVFLVEEISDKQGIIRGQGCVTAMGDGGQVSSISRRRGSSITSHDMSMSVPCCLLLLLLSVLLH